MCTARLVAIDGTVDQVSASAERRHATINNKKQSALISRAGITRIILYSLTVDIADTVDLVLEKICIQFKDAIFQKASLGRTFDLLGDPIRGQKHNPGPAAKAQPLTG